MASTLATARRRRRPAALPTRRSELKKLGAIALVLGSLLGSAQAVRQPDDLIERPLEAAGAPARAWQNVSWTVPDRAAKAWLASRFAAGAWQALWDADTGVPSRIYGEGVAAPGSLADPAIAEAAARKLLDAELAVLAPGAKPDEFVLAVDVVHQAGTRRTVSFTQTHGGLPVVAGRVSFLFASDRITMIASTAVPDLAVTIPTRAISATKARPAAAAWIEEAYGGAPVVLDDSPLTILPIVRDRGAVDVHVVMPVSVDLASPRGLWTVYVDATTGEPVARRQRLMFASGTVSYRVPERYPDGVYSDFPASFATHEVNGSDVTSNGDGLVSWSGGASSTVAPSVFGTYAEVTTTGSPVATSFTLAPGGTAVWDLSTDEQADAQLSAFIHVNVAKQFVRDNFDDPPAWNDQVIPVFVNEEGSCNAFSNLDDIHFFPESGGCANTARLADVVYHEFGHSLHAQSLIESGQFDSAFSEGISDYMSATITNDPKMGIGFTLSDAPLRHIDQEGHEYRWPDDNDLDVHETGIIIADAMWDLREALMNELGAGPGQALADDLFYAMVRRADGIPSGYLEVLAADDNDGDLANGTPHQCTIDTVFAAHGLTAFGGDDFGIVGPAVSDNRVLTLAQPAGNSRCDAPRIVTASVTWRLRRAPTTIGSVEFELSGDDATAQIPAVPDGEVVQYQINAMLDDGTSWTLPRNLADPWYELYVGPVTKLFCLDMDTDPAELDVQLTSDFQWAPAEPGSRAYDPPTAYTGSNVIGTGLGGRGAYGEDQTSHLILPELDVSGYTSVRLQYRRWLTTEDSLRDPASILADGAELWSNANDSTGQLDHRDLEWRFHDVDLTALSGNGKVVVDFRQVSDADRELGGWTVDDVCVVAAGAPVCGDDRQTVEEQCDDGNTDDGDGCSAGCHDEMGPLPPDEDAPGCCSTGSDGAPGALVLGLLTLGLARRRFRLRR